MNRTQHWDNVFRTNAPSGVSWFQEEPTASLRMLEAAGLTASS